MDPGESLSPENTRAIRIELLDSAVNVIKHDDYYTDVFFKAAALFRSLVKNHAFFDGNKRTAVTATDVFLGINGYDFKPHQRRLVKFTLKVAKGYIRELPTIKLWIRKYSHKLSEEEAQKRRTLWEKLKEMFQFND